MESEGGGEEGGEKEWLEVQSKRQRQQERKENGSKGTGKEPETSFLATNLPDDCSTKGLWEEFQVFGNVSDVYIARKRDVHGNVFAFVRFTKVLDIQEMLLSMKGLKIGRCNVVVSLAKYGKGGVKIIYPQKQGVQAIGEVANCQPSEMKATRKPRGEKTFGELIKEGDQAGSSVLGLELSSSEFPEKIPSLPSSVLVTAKDLNALNSMGLLFNGEAKLRYVGGLKLIASFKSLGEANSFVQNKLRWEAVIASIEPWEGQPIQYERIAWLRIRGVPLHLWFGKIFDKIGARYGEIVRSSGAEVKDDNLTCKWVGVMVKSGAQIEEELKVIWKGDVFSCWVREADQGWVPFFVNPTDVRKTDLEKSDAGLTALIVSSSKENMGKMNVDGTVSENISENTMSANSHSVGHHEPQGEGARVSTPGKSSTNHCQGRQLDGQEVSAAACSPIPFSLSFAPKVRKKVRPKLDHLDLTLGVASEIHNITNPGVPRNDSRDVGGKKNGKVKGRCCRVRKGVKVLRMKVGSPGEIT